MRARAGSQVAQSPQQLIDRGAVTRVGAAVGEDDPSRAVEDEVAAKLQDILSGGEAPEAPAAAHRPEVVGQDVGSEEHSPAPALQAESPISSALGVAEEWERPWLQAEVGRECRRLALADRDQLGPQGVNGVEMVLHPAEVRLTRNSDQVAQEDDQQGPGVEVAEGDRRPVGAE